MRSKLVLALGAVALMGVACNDTTPVPNSTEANKTVAGAWQYTSGENFGVPPWYHGDPSVKYMSFNENGTGTITYQNTKGPKALWCADFTFSVLSDNSVLLSSQFFNDLRLEQEYLQQYAVVNSQLTLTSNSGKNAVFTQVAEVPADFVCKHFASSESTENLEPSAYGLTYDGTQLWLQKSIPPTSDYDLYPYDLTAKTIGTPVTWASQAHVFTFQGADVWTQIGSATTLSRRTMGDVENLAIDTTAAPFSYPVGVDAAVWDGTNLWIHGSVEANDRSEFVKVDVVAGTKLDAKPFDMGLQAMTWDGTYFWGLQNGPSPIVKIDPATFEVVATYYAPTTPGYNIFYSDKLGGIAAVGSDIYLLVSDWMYEKTSTIIKVTP